ncbi:ATP-binding protein [Streptomyces tropicalis]|uniref:ATP-binding protein n=1 Tax=Streptomyces tropicalis TaxID=3034234 RepID=A0ABT6A1Z1_9ACTN|nr:ATP-binding protein [Streptomyces tropicalis]MDF3297830.1 ATP-binding protein [Streptomyces tropicalis]
MDPNTRGPQDVGHDGDGHVPRQRPPRDSLASDFAPPAPVRTARLVTGDFLLTVNPVDGSEIEVCPPGERPGRPPRHPAAERADRDRSARPPVPPGPMSTPLDLLERQEEREQLVRLLARGRSVRLTGPSGSGRTSLLDLVADDCADLAPDGVVRLSGFRRTATDLLHDLLRAVHDAPRHRLTHDELLATVREIGAVVVVDDLECGGPALDELLDATPECAFLLAVTPDVPAPSASAAVEEIALGGLDRAGGAELLERAVGRVLTEEESNWAGDLWFESEGLPLRFVQAGALLRRRDRLRAGASAVDEFGVFEDALPGDAPHDAAALAAGDGGESPLPSLGLAAAPGPLLASQLTSSARATLRFAVALGGEVPHQAHLPALVGDTHADAALGELAACGLVSPVGSRYRLAAGVLTQMEAAGYADDAEEQARTAARHYAWWAGHPSVTPERVCAEADAVLAALAQLVPSAAPEDGEEQNTAVRLARTAAPAFAAGLHWSAWERALRFGAEASRLTGDVAEQAYFHHELGVLALCEGRLDRARAELETSIGLRGALADKRGTVAGRRALALVDDRSGTPGLGVPAGLGPAADDEAPTVRGEEKAAAAGRPQMPFPALQPPGTDAVTLVSHRGAAAAPDAAQTPAASGAGVKSFARRNLVAAGAGALLAAVLGTVVTLGATSHNDANDPAHRVDGNPSTGQGLNDGDPGADTPPQGDQGRTGTGIGSATGRPAGTGATRGAGGDAAPAAGTAAPSDAPSGTRKPGGGPSTSSGPTPSRTAPPSGKPSTPSSPSPSPTTSKSSGGSPTPSPTGSTGSSTVSPSTSDTAGGPTASAPASSAGSASAPDGGGRSAGDSVI